MTVAATVARAAPAASAAPKLPIHVLVASMGTAGDVFPFLAIAEVLRQRGHHVTFLCPEQHEAHVRRAGFAFTSLVDNDVQRASQADPDLWSPKRSMAVVWRTLNDVTERLCAAVAAVPAGNPCALLVHPLLVPHADIARASRNDAVVVAGYLAPANLRTIEDPMRAGPLHIPKWVPMAWRRGLWSFIDRTVIDPHTVPSINADRSKRGLPPIEHLMSHMYSAPDAGFTLFPEWFARTRGDWPPLVRGNFPLHHPDPAATLSDELARFLDAGAPPVVFTPGSGHLLASEYFRTAVDAATRAGLRAVLLTSDEKQVPADLPAHVLWQRWVPLHTLLPKAAAFAHHGGIGTTADALRAGIPQLVMPMAHDQFDNADRVRYLLGAGHVLNSEGLRADKLADALTALLASDEVRQASRAISARLAGPSDLAFAAHLIEDLITAKRAVRA